MTEPTPDPPVARIEHVLRWRAWPTLLFITNLTLLLVAGIVSVTMKPQRPSGLPEDARARVVRDIIAGRIAVATGPMRWQAALLGGTPVANRAPDAAMLARVSEARAALEPVVRQHARDPRGHAALAALAMVTHDHVDAIHRYRAACERAPHYGEGRLGLGVALALLANRTPEVWQSRQLRLEAIAQFAAVDADDPLHSDAVHNRALLLAEVGRTREAARFAQRWLDSSATGEDIGALRDIAAAH